ncbi:hypothetical protein SSAG_00466 [Streptomyces sp. Mg1]|nr:hypothetical protein SSAG_00466 [Streptomyces sp. Mg1]
MHPPSVERVYEIHAGIVPARSDTLPATCGAHQGQWACIEGAGEDGGGPIL